MNRGKFLIVRFLQENFLKITLKIETSKYQLEKKSTEIMWVVASENVNNSILNKELNKEVNKIKIYGNKCNIRWKPCRYFIYFD